MIIYQDILKRLSSCGWTTYRLVKVNLSGVPKKHHIGVLKRLAEWGVSIERKMDWCALADALLAPDGAPAVSGTEVDKELLNVGVFVPTNL